MSTEKRPVIFGEVLFDCFPDGQQMLGGAPFNVAWHLQAFGDRPRFVSRVGKDAMGDRILHAMQDWGMDTGMVQIDPEHGTGRVDVKLVDNEPAYTIKPDCAYDFIDAGCIEAPEDPGVLYHGTLALRNTVTRSSLDKLAGFDGLSVFMDVNLRTPWWDRNDVLELIGHARWVKLNADELLQLGDDSDDIESNMLRFQERYRIELLVVTRGSEGAVVSDADGRLHRVRPRPAEHFVDTVGAGDAFTSVFLHGLLADWPIEYTLEKAQGFASAIVGLRGAVSRDPGFYQGFDLG